MAKDEQDTHTIDFVGESAQSDQTVEAEQSDKTSLQEAQEELDDLLEESHPKSKFSNSFSDSDVQDLITMWQKHYTVREIAGYLGRPFNNVRNKVAALQKKGIIKARDTRNKVPQTFIMETAGKYNVPIDVVLFLSSLFTGGVDKIMSQTETAVEQYVAQEGQCYYLGERVRLTMDTSPSGVVVVTIGLEMALVCRAVAGMRMTMSHEAFVGVCKLVAQRFPS